MSKSETNDKVVSSGGPPRLCHVVKVEDFDGYGFNLHAEKGKPGQYIGKVDDASPAELAGLKQGDRIIEVNGVNIGRETHKEVVQRIKAIASEVQLLVVDPTVAVTKDNRLVDPVPVNGVPKTNGNHSDESEKPKSPAAVVASITPDIVVQLPSTPSTPKQAGTRTSSGSIDQTDHVAQKSVPSSPIIPAGKPVSTNGKDEIIAIKVNTENVTPITVNTSKTSTFSTSPKDHSPTYNSMFISTASFNTGDETIKDEVKVVSNVTVIPPLNNSSHTTPSSSPLLPKSEIINIPSVTSASAVPPPSPKPDPSSPVVPKTATTPSVTAAYPLANGSPATPSPPSVVSQTNGTKTSNSGGLNLNMTAAELRAKLASKKKFDPKADQVDVRKKYEIVEKL